MPVGNCCPLTVVLVVGTTSNNTCLTGTVIVLVVPSENVVVTLTVALFPLLFTLLTT